MLNIDNAKEAVFKLQEIFPNAWVEFGVLLGCVRSGEFIPWDGDIDFGILLEDFVEEDIERAKKAGFSVFHKVKWNYKPSYKYIDKTSIGKYTKLKFKYKNVKICFNIYSSGANSLRYFSSGNKKRLVAIPEHYLLETTDISFYDGEIRVPKDYNGYLEFAYGNNWKTPDPKYINSAEHKKSRSRFIVNI